MTDQKAYIIDPMTAFYAAVTAVENGSIGEIDIMFTNESDETQVAMSISITIRREPQKINVLPSYKHQEE